MGQRKYSRMDQVKFFKYFFPQILLGPFLNDLSHLLIAHALIWFLNSGRDFTFYMSRVTQIHKILCYHVFFVI